MIQTDTLATACDRHAHRALPATTAEWDSGSRGTPAYAGTRPSLIEIEGGREMRRALNKRRKVTTSVECHATLTIR